MKVTKVQIMVPGREKSKIIIFDYESLKQVDIFVYFNTMLIALVGNENWSMKTRINLFLRFSRPEINNLIFYSGRSDKLNGLSIKMVTASSASIAEPLRCSQNI